MRAISLLTVVLMLIGLISVAAPRAAHAQPVPRAAAIDLGGLFGDENEADENETDEGSPAASNQGSSSTSPLVVLLLVAAAAIVVAFVVNRVRRLWRRLRAWAADFRPTRP